MRFESPPRAAHRATAGGLALLVRGGGPAGQHRPAPVAMGAHARTRPLRPAPVATGAHARTRPLRPAPVATGAHARTRPPRRARPEPQRAAQWLSHGLAAAIVLGLVTMIGVLALGGDRAAPRPAVAAPADPLGSRADDPAPLTRPEVFPGSRELAAGGAVYRLAAAQVDDCRAAVTGELGPVLDEHGCSQVVRAALIAPYDDYEVTAGVVNLADATGAADVDGRLRQLVETGDGSFAAMGRPGTDPVAAATAQVGWHALGHYVLYCVITRPGGELVSADDPYAVRITAELVDAYLGGSVLGRRASGA